MLRHTIPLPTLERESTVTVAVVNRHAEAIPVRLELVTGDGTPLGDGAKRAIPARGRLSVELGSLVPLDTVEIEERRGPLFLEVSHFGSSEQISAWLVLSRDRPARRQRDARAAGGAGRVSE